MFEPNPLHEACDRCVAEPNRDEQDWLRNEQAEQDWLRAEQAFSMATIVRDIPSSRPCAFIKSCKDILWAA